MSTPDNSTQTSDIMVNFPLIIYCVVKAMMNFLTKECIVLSTLVCTSSYGAWEVRGWGEFGTFAFLGRILGKGSKK